MNRRGFITALAALVPASLVPKPERYEWTAVSSPEIRVDPDDPLIQHMRKAAEAAGESFSMSKGLVGCENILGHKGT